ncbi:MAG: SIR2 family protein [Sedimentisphaerales bacterium]|nr:SIR2 family protein [Sedimentisphaerales bacterium]
MVLEDWPRAIDNNISQIAEELQHGRIGFLFGAGMSIQKKDIPSKTEDMPGHRLAFELILRGLYRHEADKDKIDETLKKQIEDAAGRYPLEVIASGIESELPFRGSDLTQILKQAVFEGKEPQPHEGHTHLASIMSRLNIPRLLFTTNWDTLIEDALGDRSVTIINDPQIFKLEEILLNKIGVVHLHGTFDNDPLIKETDLMSPDRPLFSLFLAELMTKSLVFIGYSLSDPNMRALYFRVNEILTKQRVNLGKTTYVVFPARDDVDRTLSAAVWDAPSRNAKYIPLDADEFFKRLKEQLETKGIKELKDELGKRLGVGENELNNKIEEIKSVFPDLGTTKQVLGYLDGITQGGS